ncbi:unnamed protein product [Heterobilharzia americana]|nr:unnamed protein product [Heterobilharzia americana]
MCIMNQNSKYFWILLYILLNILNRHYCLTIQCYRCKFCPELNGTVEVVSGCTTCTFYGTYPEIFRNCLLSDKWLPQNGAKPHEGHCFTDLCNVKKFSPTTEEPSHREPTEKIPVNIMCYACTKCTKGQQTIQHSCGACATHLKPGYTDKYCLNSCDEAPDEQGVSCCTTDLCNGMTKLNFHGSAIIFILVLTGINVFIL